MTYIKTICKIGQGSKCCRYLTVGGEGYRCQKLSPFLRNVLDAKVATMAAKADNCEGFTDNIDLLKEQVPKSIKE